MNQLEQLTTKLENDYKQIEQEQLALDHDYKYYKIAMCYELKEYIEQLDEEEEFNAETIRKLNTYDHPLSEMFELWCDRDDSLWQDFHYLLADVREYQA